ncbi:ketoacyl-ACP synthase III family protein [Streptacidiphilus sp. MAP12-33]|uniref:ketoacyl-ACP synthase III family protein n=1 Tax=Streptacidiphilus sp. MAP12-33 TaxID=3156266 RepID=UPI003519A884
MGLHLPPAMPAQEAVRLGLTDDWTVRRTRMRGVCVSEDESGPQLAVRAARQALRQAGTRPDDVELVLHASSWFQGYDLWAPASYVQREAVGNTCLSLHVEQLSNGGMAALELAVAYLRAGAARHSALVTTGDRFCLPGIDRWASDPGTILADGGTALVVSTAGGFALIRSLVTISDPTLEKMGRGDDPFAAAPMQTRNPVSVEEPRARLVKEIGMAELIDRLHGGQQRAFEEALEQADVKRSELDWTVLPNLGKAKMDFQFFQALELEPEQTTWPWGAGVGHLGAGDMFAGLAHLVQTQALRPGQIGALVSAGGGFAWTVAILEILETP